MARRCWRFEEWLEARPDARPHPTVRYAIGRALLERVGNADAGGRDSAKIEKRAREHLQRAAGSNDLGNHQREIAERLLSDRLPSKRR